MVVHTYILDRTYAIHIYSFTLSRFRSLYHCNIIYALSLPCLWLRDVLTITTEQSTTYVVYVLVLCTNNPSSRHFRWASKVFIICLMYIYIYRTVLALYVYLSIRIFIQFIQTITNGFPNIG